MLSIGSSICGTKFSRCILTTKKFWSSLKASISWSLRKAPKQSNTSLTGNFLNCNLVYTIFLSNPFYHPFFVYCSSFCRYIYHELVVQNTLLFSYLPTFLLNWIDDNSNFCVYTSIQLAKFSLVQLVDVGWYLDCSHGFVPKVEEALYNSLVSSTIKVIELRKSWKKMIQLLYPIRKIMYWWRARAKARVRMLPHMSLLRCLLVLSQRPRFNALLHQPSPLLEVQPPLPHIMLPLLLIAVQPSHLCMTWRRLLHRIYQRLPRRGHLLSRWLRMWTWESLLRISWGPRFLSNLPPHTRIPNQDLCIFLLFSLFVLWNSIHIFLFTSFWIFYFAGWSGPYSTECQAKGSYGHWYVICRCAWEPACAEDLGLILGYSA